MADRADIVIGANFGDEGKGLVTDYLAHGYGTDTLVVRHNGGAQAGHTVTTPEGHRHVFKHFSSGTFAGAKTFLSRFFVCNPILYFKELQVLKGYGLNPIVYVDADAPISTPYDMMINQMVEEHRGHGRHGSCGVGFGETIERNMRPEYALTFRDLSNSNILAKKLKIIRHSWVQERLSNLGVSNIPNVWNSRIFSDDILTWYVSQAEDFVTSVHRAPLNLLQESRHVIFEGAQGLLLDQDHGWFPHVTRSSTGIKNAIYLAHRAGIENIDITYITRAYNTRHGAGPLPHELPEKPYDKIFDPTNIHNEYQGSLRFGWLDVDLLASSVFRDLQYALFSMNVKHRIAITCVDQLEKECSFISKGKRVDGSRDDLIRSVTAAVGASEAIVSRGPTRRTMSRIHIKDVLRQSCSAI